MKVRHATSQDVPAIVELLKQSLGESLVPKSAAYWMWKHVNNPYGESPTLLSEDGGRIVGVRAFMRWQWKQGDRRFEAVRAVDTATHPDYQGKGIFRKLTLDLLEECKGKGWAFVFNTPNEKSKPGYIKMGWSEAGKLPIDCRLVRPLGMALNVVRQRPQPVMPADESVGTYLRHAALPALIAQTEAQIGGRVQTVHSVDSLRWRYEDVPVEQYFAAGETGQNDLRSLFFYRVKPSRLGLEFRVTDLFLASPDAVAGVKRVLKEEVRKRKAHYVTLGSFSAAQVLSGGLSWKGASLGPIVTVRDINMGDDLGLLRGFTRWSPSLGDLELF